MLGLVTAILLNLTPGDPIKLNFTNSSGIEKIGERNVTFGAKETLEEKMYDLGYQPVADTAQDGMVVYASLDKIESPQQVFTIFGLKWLRKDYVVTTSMCIGSGCFEGKGMRRTYVFAAFLDVENNEVPLNYKAYSKALQASFDDLANFTHKKQ